MSLTAPSTNQLTVTQKSVPTDHEMMVYHTMAEQAVSSKMYRGIGEKAGVMMIMLAARELGIPPMQALNGGLNIISGKVEISARMMNALIRKAGHKVITKEICENSCTLEGQRFDTGETQITSFTLAEAQKAGLVKVGGGWQKFPSDMCYARALSRLARQLFPDVIGIGYVEGEIKAVETEVVITEKPEDILNSLLDKFSEEDKPLFLEYVEVVSKHFGWTQEECLSKFSKEKVLTEKFDAWKAKTKGLSQ